MVLPDKGTPDRANSQMSSVIDHLRRAAVLQDEGDLTDG
jgi:hypothetical protein